MLVSRYIFLFLGLATGAAVWVLVGCNAGEAKESATMPAYESVRVDELRKQWEQLTIEERVGQLLWLQTQTSKQADTLTQQKQWVTQAHLGGIIIRGQAPEEVRQFISYFNAFRPNEIAFGVQGDRNRMLAIDALPELASVAVLQANTNDSLFARMAAEYAAFLDAHGVDLWFDPPWDNWVAVDTLLPQWQSRKLQAWLSGLHQMQVLAPVNINKISSNPRVWQPLLTQLVRQGLNALIQPRLPDAQRARWYQQIDSLGFQGLVFSTCFCSDTLAPQLAQAADRIKQGADVLVVDGHLRALNNYLVREYRRDSLLRSKVDQKSFEVMKARHWSRSISKGHNDLLANGVFEQLRYSLQKNSLIMPQNNQNNWPIGNLNQSIAAVSINDGQQNLFINYLRRYAHIESIPVSGKESWALMGLLNGHLNAYDQVIISLHPQPGEKEIHLSAAMQRFIKHALYQDNVSLVAFDNGRVLSWLTPVARAQSILIAHNNTPQMQSLAAQAIFGGVLPRGKLPQPVPFQFAAGTGEQPPDSLRRLSYARPAQLGIDEMPLLQIDSIVQDAIRKGAFPGCQIVAAHKGTVFFSKQYGHTTYGKTQRVSSSHIYDLASVTKILSTTLSVMHLYDQGRLQLNQPISHYIPAIDTTNKKDLILKDVLGHQARLAGWIPFYYRTYDRGRPRKLRTDLYSSTSLPGVETPVADQLYMLNTYRDSIYAQIYSTDLRRFRRYKYSDIGFYLLEELVRQLTHTSLDRYTDSLFYRPLGAYSVGYNPLKKYPKNQIVPTENDTYYRHQLLQGYVQDRGAAILGGVAGHAGLFGSAPDIAKLMQMLLNQGIYGGRRFFQPNTINLFTSNPFLSIKNRRGLGFDKPAPIADKGYTCEEASKSSYGHTGFTGTMVWADPEYDMIYVFLSNRIHPDIRNNKISHLKVREKVQQALYHSLP